MATIKVADLISADSKFFTNSESYSSLDNSLLTELSDVELSTVSGGGFWEWFISLYHPRTAS